MKPFGVGPRLPDIAPFAHHGGALDLARTLYPLAPEPWIDLSTGINPVPYPIGPIPADAWRRLPEAADLARLEQAAAARYRAPPGAETVAAPGTQAIIQRLPQLCGSEDVRVLGRSYGEYARVFHKAGAKVTTVSTLEALAGADVAIIVNPNNPDGRLVPVEALLALTARVGALVVDEAFMDAVPQSLVPQMPSARVVVLRSFGKMYGLAGLRLGFAVLAPDRAARLRDMLGPWAVAGPALAIGTAVLADGAWLAASHARLQGDGVRLMALLRRAGATEKGGTQLFRLVSHPAAPALFEALASHGILTRPFDDEPTWLRFGHPGSDGQWARLERALLAF